MMSTATRFPRHTIMTVLGGIVPLLLLAACNTAGSERMSSQQGSASGSVSGTVAYRERIALPPDAVVEVVLLGVSRMDVAAATIAEQTIEPSGQIPVHFELVYDTAVIDQPCRVVIIGSQGSNFMAILLHF